MTSGGTSEPTRSLADILREAGIEAAGRGGRRRKADPAEAEPPEPVEPAPPVEPALTAPPGPAEAENDAWTDATGPIRTAEPLGSLFTPAVEPAPAPVSAPGGPPTPRRRAPTDAAADGPGEPDEDGAGGFGPARAALGWLLFAVELVLAAVLGVLIWYAFSLLWELYPYVAALAAPFVLTGVVIGGRVVRRRSGRRLGLPALITLLLVGTLLVVLPAAAVLSGG